MNLDDEDRENNAKKIWREISGASPFRRRDVKDPYGLVFRLRDSVDDRVPAYLRATFSWPTRQQMDEYDGIPPAPEQLVQAVLGEFNRLIEGPCIYDERRFAGVELTDEATRLLGGVIEGIEQIRLNRILLEAVCWPTIACSNSFTQNLHSLERWAGFLLIGKTIHGEVNGEAYFTPTDVAVEAIARMAEGRPVWQPEQSRFLTFTCLVMRSIVSHKLDKFDNTKTERISRPLPLNNNDVSSSGEDERLSDSGRGGKMFITNAEYINIMELFYEDSPERKVLEVINRSKGDERLGEIAAELSMSVREVKKTLANVMEMLTKLNYFRE